MANRTHTPSNEPDFRILSALERLEAPLLLAAALVAACVLIVRTVPWAAALAPTGLQDMPSATASGVLLATLSLLLSSPRRPPLAHRFGQIIGLFVMAVPLLVVLDYLGLHPHHVFPWPVPPSPQAAVAFALAAASLPFIGASRGPFSIVADGGAVAAIAFVLFLFGARAFDVGAFVGADGINLTAPQTLFCLSLLAFVIGARRAAEGRTLAILVNIGIGSQITRKVLPAVLVVPFLVFMLISYLNQHELVSTAASRAVAAPFVVLATLSVLGWMGWHANQLERQLRQQSMTDALTGVLNRRGLDTVVEYTILHAKRAGTPLVVFYFDLDGLKIVNDTLGHETGSQMIKAFADILSTTFRKSDVIARVGGDEFVVVAAASSADAAELLLRLRRNVEAGNAAGDRPYRVSYSDGHAELTSGGERTIADLVAEADAMMYARKMRKRAA